MTVYCEECRFLNIVWDQNEYGTYKSAFCMNPENMTDFDNTGVGGEWRFSLTAWKNRNHDCPVFKSGAGVKDPGRKPWFADLHCIETPFSKVYSRQERDKLLSKLKLRRQEAAVV